MELHITDARKARSAARTISPAARSGTNPSARAAFAELYQQHAAAIGRYIYHRVGNRELAEDLVGDVFLQALRGLHRYRDRGVPIRAWLLRIASNRVNRWARRERGRALAWLEAGADVVDPRTQPGPVDETEHERERVRKALLTLPPKYQSTIALHYFEGLSVDEIAAACGRRANTIKSHLLRGRQRLRLALENHVSHGRTS